MNDRRVFQLTTSRVIPPPTPEQEARAEAFDEAILIARLYEERGATAGAVRHALEARARISTETERGAAPADRDGEACGGQTSAGLPRSVSVITPLDEAPQPGRASGASSSGAGTDGQPSSSPEGAPLTYDDWLGHITRMYDEVLRALGTPEPQSRKAFPKLRRVK